MSLQRYRIDETGKAEPNGSVPLYSDWRGGPSLAAIRNCPVDIAGEPRRMVYVTAEPDTYFSQPAACCLFGIDVKGILMHGEDGYNFAPTRPAPAVMPEPPLVTVEAKLAARQIEAHMINGRWWHLRRNGATQTWLRRPGEFRIPVKAGLRSYGELTHATRYGEDEDFRIG